jgi:hypothetical protein
MEVRAMDHMSGGATSGSGQDVQLVKDISLPLYNAKGWMKLLGVLSIISGILTALSLWGIIFAWLPIWLGVLLFKAAGSVETAWLGGHKGELEQAMRSLKTYFTINGIVMLIYLIIGAVAMIVFAGGILGALASGH